MQSGGQLRLASQSNIETNGNLNSSSGGGIAGNVTIEAAGDVTFAGDILSTGETAAGTVEIGTTDGNINLGSSNIEAFSENGAGGSVTLDAAGSVTTSNITTFGNSASGDVTISSGENAIDIGTIQTNAEESAPSGSVTLNTFTAEGNIQSANIAADETGQPTGNVEVVAPDGSTRIENLGESNVEATPTPTGEESPEATPTPTGEDSTQLQPESSVTQPQLTPEGESAIAPNTSPNNNETFALSVQNNNEVVTAVSGSTINTSGNSNSDIVREPSSETFSTSSNNIIEHSNVTSSESSVRILQTNLANVKEPTAAASSEQITLIEQTRNSEFSNYFAEELSNQTLSTVSVGELLSDIAKQTENQSAVIYVTAYSNQLQLVLFTPRGDAILKTIPEANREELMKVVKKFREEITKGKNILYRNQKNYLSPAQQLYQWLIAPIEAELQAANIETLLFSIDEGLRALPVAALHDGEEFLVEKYSLS